MDQDERFKHIKTDPKFRRIPKSERKVKIDKRFQSMFNDEKFKLKYTVDKRGRPVNHTSTEDLKRYYELNSDEESDQTSDENEEKVLLPSKEEQGLNIKKKGDRTISEDIKKKLKDLSVDYARGEAAVASGSSSDDEESEEEFSESEQVDHGWGELDKDAPRTEEATKRLAVCNLDWDRIRAVDIMVLFNSFVPSGGVIHSVIIYPSDFGLQRMKEEEIRGPIELVKNDDESEEETEEGSKYHMEKLRQYQLNRLKYYYAVVTCDSEETANKIYSECDGMEYESSATKIDLRFIPDDMEFENEAKETCEKMPEKYEPRFFTTTALQQAKVELTWDETNPERLEITKKLASGKIDDVTETDLQAYLASSSEEESENDETEIKSESEEDIKNPIDKYRALLQDIENNEKQKDNKGVEMEISWGLNVKEKADKLVKKKMAENEEKTPFQQYLDKRKEKKKTKREERKKKLEENRESDDEQEDSDIPSDIDMNDTYFAEEFNKPEFKKKSKTKKSNNESKDDDEKDKAELELLLLNENEDTRKHFNMKKIQEQENSKSSKNKKKRRKAEKELQEDEFEVDVKDDRFSALYSSHHYNVDPTDPRYRKTKGMEAIIEEKLKRRTNEDGENVSVKKKPKKDAELSVLVKSIKRKTKALGAKK